MKTVDIQVRVAHGIHLRVASGIAQLIKDLKAKVYISKGEQKARADSILELVLLEATENSKIRVTAEGVDEVKAIAKIEEFFTDGAGI